MLDLIGAVAITTVIAVNLVAVVATFEVPLTRKLALAGAAGLWIGSAVALGAAGAFADAGTRPFPLIGVFLIVPLLAALVLAPASQAARRMANSLILPLLIGLNVGRVFGGFFLLLAAQERLGGPFPYSAGWGDVLTGVLAVPVALMAARDPRRHAGVIAAWNLFGMLDLVVAVALGIASSNGSPLQLIVAGPGSAAVQVLPWVLIPAVLVPFYLVLHGLVFARLWAATPSRPIPVGSS